MPVMTDLTLSEYRNMPEDILGPLIKEEGTFCRKDRSKKISRHLRLLTILLGCAGQTDPIFDATIIHFLPMQKHQLLLFEF
jgi:hypothetical protein